MLKLAPRNDGPVDRDIVAFMLTRSRLARVLLSALLVVAAATSGCGVARGVLDLPSTASGSSLGVLEPPPDGASGLWTMSMAGHRPAHAQLDVSKVLPTAQALQGKLVTVVCEPTDVPLAMLKSVVVTSIAKARIDGTLRRAPIDAHHPTGWIFATTMFNHPMDLPLDPGPAMPAAEQLVGKKAVFTGTMHGEARTGLRLVADTLETP